MRIAGAINLRSHSGLTVIRLLDGIGVRRGHVAGHSYGGLIALQLEFDIAEQSERVTGAVPCICPDNQRAALIFTAAVR
jgi:hypothetical protein